VLSGCGGGDDSSADSSSAGTTTSAESANADSASAGSAGQDKGGQKPQPEDRAKAPSGTSKSKAAEPAGERESGITPEQRRKATVADVKLESPAFASGAAIPTRYGCGGENESPALKWSDLPPEAAELVLLVLNSVPVDEALFFNYAVAGIDPSLSEVKAGEVPAGAVVGKNSSGTEDYSLCPPKGKSSETYVFMLYAIPKALDPEPGFDPLKVREAVLAEAGNVGYMVAPYAGG
jgi:phosphatidylethanolamine-binding protein (PEBP) family uncharacterized protein